MSKLGILGATALSLTLAVATPGLRRGPRWRRRWRHGASRAAAVAEAHVGGGAVGGGMHVGGGGPAFRGAQASIGPGAGAVRQRR